MKEETNQEYYDYEGIGRVKLIVLSTLSAIAQVVLIGLGLLVHQLLGGNFEKLGLAMWLYLLTIVTSTIIYNLYLLYQRNKNIGINPWVGLALCFVPIVNFFWGIIVYIGQEGFWEEKHLDGPGKVWASIIVILIIALVGLSWITGAKLNEIKNMKGYIQATSDNKNIFQPPREYPPVKPVISKDEPSYGLNTTSQDFNKTTRKLNEIVQALESQRAEDSRKILAEIAKNQGYLNPLVIGLATNLVVKAGQNEKALFWFYAGELRTLSDLNLYKDKSIPNSFLKQYLGEGLKGGRVSALSPSTRTQIELFIKENPEIAKAQLSKALAWDKKTSKSYDRLWLGKDGAIAQHQWQAQDQKTRNKFTKNELSSIGVGEIDSVFKPTPNPN